MKLKDVLETIYFTERVEIFDSGENTVAHGRCEDVAKWLEKHSDANVTSIESGLENGYGNLHAIIYIITDYKKGEY